MAGFAKITNSRSSSSVVETSRQVAAWPSGRAPSTTSTTPKTLSASPAILSTTNGPLPFVAGGQTGPNLTGPSSVVGPSRQVAASPSGRAPSTASAAGKVNGSPGRIVIQAGAPSEAVPHGPSCEPSGGAMDGVESGPRAIRGSRRVDRLTKMGLGWQVVQQQAQQAQAAALAPTSSRELNERELRAASERWHAAQPPPPPEALPYISTRTKKTKRTQ
ncbi:hypothetical protein FRC01_000813 [Tulasnella sp. 417]|nr:hypothetical protein FRC01_000813 [Tulasnella sp. 417]